MTGPWTIIETTEYSAWFLSLSESQQDAINDRIQKLREKGPLLTRPYADHIKGSEISNLKELRISSKGVLRILFVFDPTRNAVLLLGGNKAEGHQWNRWYSTAIPFAEQIYKRHLEESEERE
jgi:hypothetical protein